MNIYLSSHRKHQVLLALFTLGIVAWGASLVWRVFAMTVWRVFALP